MEAAEYYDRSIDLLESIYLYQEDANKKLNSIADASDTLYFTVDEYIKKGGKGASSTESTFGKLDTLVTKIDTLINKMSGVNADAKTGAIDPATLEFLKSDITGIGKSLFFSIPYFSFAKPHIPTIVNSINSLVSGLIKGTSELKKEDLEKTQWITKLLSGDFTHFAKSLFTSVPYLIALRPISTKVGHWIGGTINNILSGIKADVTEDKAKAAMAIVSGIATNVVQFAKKLVLVTPLTPIAFQGSRLISRVIHNISNTMMFFGDKEIADTIEKGSNLTAKVANSVLSFAVKMALAAPILPIAFVSAKLFTPIINSVGSAIINIGERADDFEKGEKATGKLSLSLLSFSAALALSTPLLLVGLVGFGLAALAIGGLAFEYTMIGAASEQINKGSWAVLGIAATVVLFSGSLALAGLLIPKDDSVPALALGLLMIGGIYGLVGLAWEQVSLGALSFGLIGLSLLVLSYPLATVAGVMKGNENFFWKLPAMLLGIGAVYALAGVASELIIPGALAMGLVGASLIPFAYAFKTLMSVGTITPDMANGVERGIKAVINGIGGGFADLSMVQILALPASVATVGLMGVAVASLGWGLGKWKAAGTWTIDDSNVLKSTLTGLTGAFAVAGGSTGATKILGFSFGQNDVERGISSTRRIGDTLTSLSKGIFGWKSLAITPKEAQDIADNITSILSVVPGAFAVVGAREKKSNLKGFKIGNMSFQNPFEQGDVELGISSTRKIGDTLTSLHTGIVAWAKPIDPKQAGIMASNIKTFLDIIPTAFGAIGAAEKGSKTGITIGWGPFATKLPNPFEKGNVTAGISATYKVANVLKDVKKAIDVWMPGGKNSINPDELTKTATNITNFLTMIPAAFAKIGSKEKGTKSSFLGFTFGSGDVESGIKLVDQLLPSIQTLGEFIKPFSTGEDIASRITTTTDSIFKMIAKFISFSNDKKQVASLDSFITRWSSLGNLANPIDKLSKSMENFTRVMKGQIDLFKKADDQSNIYVKFLEGVVKLEKMDSTKFLANLNTVAGVGTSQNEVKIVNPINPKSPEIKTVRKSETNESHQKFGNNLEQKIDNLVNVLQHYIQLQGQAGNSNADVVASINSLKTQLVTSGIKVQGNFLKG